ncbi:MAG: molybdate ABC transporter substrate-binding protein, partial [Pseudonocardiaceae bacterium]
TCPYGRVARQALQDIGVWATLGDRLVLTQDAARAAELAFNGKVDAAVLPLSLAVSPLARSRGSFVVVDSKAHRPLRQRMVLITGAGETARLFYAYLQAPVAREVLRRYGYTGVAERSKP